MSVSQVAPTPGRSTAGAYPLTIAPRAGERAESSDRPVNRHTWPQQRNVAANRRRNVAPVMLRRRVVGLINDGTITLEGGNARLKSLNLAPVKGNARVSFRVSAQVRAFYDGPSRTIEHADATITDELRRLCWTSFEGCPEGYGIDEPAPHKGSRGRRRYGTVHTTLRLTVTVPAYEEDLLEQTAFDLLYRDLAQLSNVRPVMTRITPWLDELSDADGYLQAGYVDDDIRLAYADCAWHEVDMSGPADDIGFSARAAYSDRRSAYAG